MAEYVTDYLRQREEFAAESWEEQQRLHRLALEGLADSLRVQAASARARRDRTQRRVLWEMLGLLMTAVGTVLASLGS